MSATRAQLRATNDATYAAWNARDPDAVARVFHPEAELRDTGVPELVKGRRAIRERAADLLAAFGEFHIERLALVIDPPRNADRWVVTAVHTGPFLGMEPTGRRIEVEGATFTELDEDGLVIGDVNFWDVPSLLAQLGGG